MSMLDLISNAMRAGLQVRDANAKALLSQLSHEFEPWRETGITLAMVEKAYCSRSVADSMRIQVLRAAAPGVNCTP